MNVTTRIATAADTAFITEAVMAAEKSNTETISYCRIFGLSEDEFRKLLEDIFEQEIEGQELYLPNFMIAEADGTPAATISTWIEMESGLASNQLKSSALMYLLGTERLLGAANNLSLMAEVGIPRSAGAMQVECVYTREAYRGKGLFSRLVDDSIAMHRARGAAFDRAEIQLMKNNTNAIRAYERAGFVPAAEKHCTDERILELLPDSTRISMTKQVTDN